MILTGHRGRLASSCTLYFSIGDPLRPSIKSIRDEILILRFNLLTFSPFESLKVDGQVRQFSILNRSPSEFVISYLISPATIHVCECYDISWNRQKWWKNITEHFCVVLCFLFRGWRLRWALCWTLIKYVRASILVPLSDRRSIDLGLLSYLILLYVLLKVRLAIVGVASNMHCELYISCLDLVGGRCHILCQ